MNISYGSHPSSPTKLKKRSKVPSAPKKKSIKNKIEEAEDIVTADKSTPRLVTNLLRQKNLPGPAVDLITRSLPIAGNDEEVEAQNLRLQWNKKQKHGNQNKMPKIGGKTKSKKILLKKKSKKNQRKNVSELD